MAQFGAPEICLSKQRNADPLMVDTLFHVAQSVLTLPQPIPDGKAMDSPQRQAENRAEWRAREENSDPWNPPAPDEPPVEIRLAGLRHEAARRLPVIVYHGTLVPW
jgi:hypothetical protein